MARSRNRRHRHSGRARHCAAGCRGGHPRTFAHDDVARIQQIEARVQYDGDRFHAGRRRNHRRSRRGALAALRPDVERRRGHRASAANPGRVAIDRAGTGSLRRGPGASRARISTHAADRPHPRHSRRAHHLWLESRQLVRRKSPQHRAISRSRAANGRRQDLRRRGQRRASGRRSRGGHLQAPGIGSGAGSLSGNSARSPRAVRRNTGDPRRDARKNRPRKSATCNAPKCAKRKSRSSGRAAR